MEREKRVHQTTAETKSAIVEGSVFTQPERPVLTAAELQKLFVSPIVNEDGKPCAIIELDRTAQETEAALGELNAEIERVESESMVRDGVLSVRLQPLETAHESILSALVKAETALENVDTAIETARQAEKNANSISAKVDEAKDLAAEAKFMADEIYTQIDRKVSEIVDSAPETLNTLNELAAALNNDENFAATVTAQIAGKVDKIDGKGLSQCDYTPEDRSRLTALETAATGFAIKQFTDTNGAINYIGLDLTLTVSTGTHIITNCTGTVTVSGNNATVYVSNSPGLTVTGVTLDNWDKVYRDGLATYTYPLNIVRTFDSIKLNEVFNTEVTEAAYKADKIILRFTGQHTDYAAFSEELILAHCGDTYDGTTIKNLSNGSDNFPLWISLSFCISKEGIYGFRSALAPYPPSPGISITLYELYLEKRS